MIDSSGSESRFQPMKKTTRNGVYGGPRGHAGEVCEGCLRATDWSNNDKALLIFAGSPYQIDLLDVASHEQTPLLEHPKYNLLYARFSPDNRWVSFTKRTEPNRACITIAPSTERYRCLKAPGSPSQRRVLRTGLTGRPTAGRSTLFPIVMDITVCGVSSSMPFSIAPVGSAFAALHLPRPRILPAVRLVGISRPGRHGAGGNYRKYLDDVPIRPLTVWSLPTLRPTQYPMSGQTSFRLVRL